VFVPDGNLIVIIKEIAKIVINPTDPVAAAKRPLNIAHSSAVINSILDPHIFKKIENKLKESCIVLSVSH
jgi:hypothetical protein